MTPSNFKDITNQKFGNLLVLKVDRKTGKPFWRTFWLCQCVCGKQVEVDGRHLRGGKIRSCGCLYSQPKSHGLAHSRVYNIWGRMRVRCENEANNRFKWYGARGIAVCEKWKTFEGFFEDMGHPPTNKHSIDRINNDGNYEKSNCRWATASEQALNRSNNRLITHMGITKPLKMWCDIYELDYKQTHHALYKKTLKEILGG